MSENCQIITGLLVLLTVVTISGSVDLLRAEEEVSEKVVVTEWLKLGPVDTPPPVFHTEDETEFGPEELLSFRHLMTDNIRPEEDTGVSLINNQKMEWEAVSCDTSGVILEEREDIPGIAYLSAYVEVPRWTEVIVNAHSTSPFRVNLGGEAVIKSTAGTSPEGTSGRAKLKRGKHLLMVKAVRTPSDTTEYWSVKIKLSSRYTSQPPRLSLSPVNTLNIHHIMDTPSIKGVEISPEGKHIALSLSEKNPPEGETERWIEIRTSRDGKLLQTIRDIGSYSGLKWAPEGNRLSYIKRDKKKGTIRILDLDSGESETVVKDVENLSSYSWSPNSSFIIYSVNRKPDSDKSGVKRLRGLSDRPGYARRHSDLYLVSVPGGIRRKLTSGKHSSYTADIHPSAESVLITRNYEDLSERPYSVSEMILIDLATHQSRILWKGHWLRGASWSPGGEKILVSAGPSAFGEKGVNLSNQSIPNDYDTQLYIYNPETDEVNALTAQFSPAIRRAVWNRKDGYIYAIAEHTSHVNLYRINPGGDEIELIRIDADVISGGDISRSSRLAVVEGVSADSPAALYLVDLDRDRSRIIFKPARETFSRIELGRVENWDFRSSGGDVIKGRIHYPPHFDQSRKYPCIVYYYGGTSPVNRSFGGRYPKNLWASMGYVVYVLQPSGATGFGQDFSARHVNDWGRTVSDEIIEGVEKFLAAHPFVDKEAVGCIGASFGGFMTQLLVTRTDIFAAAVSHAGISSITSYWGEGYWGYAYNAVSAANSFPWNRPDIYVQQSPLYSADQIHTPLLLLHGTSDTNVPPGESEQMYTALKILGREVEYLRFAGQNHFILEYKKRIKWSDAQLAWFDRWLKGQPEWWNDMYPPLEEEGTEAQESSAEALLEMETHKINIEGTGTLLLGNTSREDIEQNFPGWTDEYISYQPGEQTAGNIASRLQDVSITCIFGTWCSDSRRDVPRMWKILEMAGYPPSGMEMLAVASSRFTADMGIDQKLISWSDRIKEHYGVERVATFIIYRKGEELGRIIEKPRLSLEEDLFNILSR